MIRLKILDVRFRICRGAGFSHVPGVCPVSEADEDLVRSLFSERPLRDDGPEAELSPIALDRSAWAVDAFSLPLTDDGIRSCFSGCNGFALTIEGVLVCDAPCLSVSLSSEVKPVKSTASASREGPAVG